MVKRILALSLLMVGLAGCGSGDGGGAETPDGINAEAVLIEPFEGNPCVWVQYTSVWTEYNGGLNGRYIPRYKCI